MVLTLIHPLAARVTGQASRRGLIPRVPTADRLLEDVQAWLTTTHADLVRSQHRSTLPSGDLALAVSLHPAARDLVLTISDSGRVTVEAETEPIGPGYHRFVGRVLERMGLDLSISWVTTGERPDEPEPWAAVTFGDRAMTERAYLGWLGPTLATARRVRTDGGRPIQIGTPDGVRYTVGGALLTALGPRDHAWLETAVADTRVAVGITPWWADATDGLSYLNRALCLMWLEVRWRAPGLKEEGLLLDEIHRLLSRAFPLDPTLPYPWAAWAEIIALRGIDDPMARQVVPRAMREGGDAAIGYRRQPVIISHEGWALEIPGSFAERRTAEEWWGGGAGRRITLAATTTGAMSAQSFIEQFAGEIGPGAIDHRAGPIVGRAMLSSDASSGLEVGVLDGYSAVVGSGAVVRIEFDDPADWQWAIDTWRSLAPG